MGKVTMRDATNPIALEFVKNLKVGKTNIKDPGRNRKSAEATATQKYVGLRFPGWKLLFTLNPFYGLVTFKALRWR